METNPNIMDASPKKLKQLFINRFINT